MNLTAIETKEAETGGGQDGAGAAWRPPGRPAPPNG